MITQDLNLLHNEDSIYTTYPLGIEYNIGDILALRYYSKNNKGYRYGLVLYKYYQNPSFPVYVMMPIDIKSMGSVPKDIDFDIDGLLKNPEDNNLLTVCNNDIDKCYRTVNSLYQYRERAYDSNNHLVLEIGLPYVYNPLNPNPTIYYKVTLFGSIQPKVSLIDESTLGNLLQDTTKVKDLVIPKFRIFETVLYTNPAKPLYPFRVFIDSVRFSGQIIYVFHKSNSINEHWFNIPEMHLSKIDEGLPRPMHLSPRGYSHDLYNMNVYRDTNLF